MNRSLLDNIVSAQKQGQAVGIASICSAHPLVIEAALRHALANYSYVLIESTCNQVNQFGGYTGMKPRDFVGYVGNVAAKVGLSNDRILLGGDHLGPNPWQDEPADTAMTKAKALVRAYVQAGYTKIHLDASMKCADDDRKRPLPKAISAARAADMAAVAEETFAQSGRSAAPRYVIGTEVPIPGGAQEHEATLTITRPEDAAETIEVTRDAFYQRGLGAAWERVVALVVQPGVEFGDDQIFAYDPEKAAALARFIEGNDRLVYEAHSTDYQTRAALGNLVRDHFAILKVGPALTFALREAIFALAMMEADWLGRRAGITLSNVRQVIEEAMLANPAYWQKYYHGDEAARRFARQFSFSDRIRYYWPQPQVQTAVTQLLRNLAERPLPLTLISQYMPAQYERIRTGKLTNSPREFIVDRVTAVLSDYGAQTKSLADF